MARPETARSAPVIRCPTWSTRSSTRMRGPSKTPVERSELETLTAAIDAVCAARRVDLYGVGASALVAHDLHYKPGSA